MELSCSLVNRPPFPPPPHHSPLPTGRAAYTLNDGPYSRVCATVYSPLGHAGLPLDGCLPRRPLAHVASARAFLPVHWYARLLHPAVASQPPEVPSNEKSHDWRVRRPTISMPARRRRQRGLLRPSSGNTPRGNTYVLVFTGSFYRRAYILRLTPRSPLRVPRTLLSTSISPSGCLPVCTESSRKTVSGLLEAFRTLSTTRIRVFKIATTSYHPKNDGGVECVSHTAVHVLAWPWSSISAKTSGIHRSRTSNFLSTVPLVPPRILRPTKSAWVGSHAFPSQDFQTQWSPRTPEVWLVTTYLAHRELVTDRQRQAYNPVREHPALTDSRVAHRNSAQPDALRPVSLYCSDTFPPPLAEDLAAVYFPWCFFRYALALPPHPLRW